jgi:hypothetical protein
MLSIALAAGICGAALSGAHAHAPVPHKPVAETDSKRDIPTKLTATRSGKSIRGEARTEEECTPDRKVRLFRRRSGPDAVVGTDTTNSLGRWGIRAGTRPGTYYARISTATVTDAETGEEQTCIGDQSRDLRRR